MESTHPADHPLDWEPGLLRRFSARLAPRPTPGHGGVDPAVPEVRLFGTTVVSRNRTGLPAAPVRGFHEDDLGLLDTLLAWVAESERPPDFVLAPWEATASVQRALTARGFAPSGEPRAVLAEEIALVQAASDGETATSTRFPIVEAGVGDASTVARIHVASNDWNAYGARLVRETLARTFPSGGIHFLALTDNNPIGTASVSVRDRIAVLRGTSVLPAWRGNGVQAALIAHRVGCASSAGAAWVLAEAEFGSTSHRNLERAGLRLAWVAERWKPAAD